MAEWPGGAIGRVVALAQCGSVMARWCRSLTHPVPRLNRQSLRGGMGAAGGGSNIATRCSRASANLVVVAVVVRAVVMTVASA